MDSAVHALVRNPAPATNKSRALGGLQATERDTPEKRTQFPRVITTTHPAAPKPRSLAGGFMTPIAPQSLRRPKTGWQFERPIGASGPERARASANCLAL